MRRLIITVVLLGFFLGCAYVAYTAVTLPNVRIALEDGVEPAQTSQIVARDNSVILSYGKFQYKPVPLKQISPSFIRALLSTEDRRFYKHNGVDPMGILRAMVVNVINQRMHQGASTITQQLARNIFLTNERSFQRKLKEILLAIKLENQLSKDEILQLYVNNIYFGEGAYGIGAASDVYFGKSPSQLTVDEAALLAGLPQAPSQYNPYVNKKLAKDRRNEVLQNMAEAGYIQRSVAKGLQNHAVRLKAEDGVVGKALGAYFSRYAVEEACRILKVDEQEFWSMGVKVVTTLDPKAQRLAERAARAANSQFGRAGSKDQYALLSLNNRGEMIAYIGGKDFSKSQYDRVTLARRQAGSIFKVFVYTAAMESGMSPQTVYIDAPVVFQHANSWRPVNYDKSHHGPMTLASAFIHSNNVIAAKLINDLHPGPVVKMARNMGVESPLKANLSLALGAPDVSLKEMTTAFSVFPNLGHLVHPFAIQKIQDHKGYTLYKHHAQIKAVLNRPTRDTMVELLTGVTHYGTGRQANIAPYAAGKTGTSDDYRNAWFIGFTPSVTTGVWVGHDDNKPMSGISGGSLPAKIWRDYMSQYAPALTGKGFELVGAPAVVQRDFFEYDIARLSQSDRDTLKREEIEKWVNSPESKDENGVPLGKEGPDKESIDAMMPPVQGADAQQPSPQASAETPSVRQLPPIQSNIRVDEDEPTPRPMAPSNSSDPVKAPPSNPTPERYGVNNQRTPEPPRRFGQ